MSLIGTIGSAVGAFQSVKSLLGGGGSDVNLARSFSSSCGFSQPVTDAVKRQAQSMGGDVCSNAWAIAHGLPPTIPTTAAIPIFPQTQAQMLDPGNILAAVTGSGSAYGMSALPGVGATVGAAVRGLSPSLKRKAIAFAKNFGIQLAATVFGLSLLEMAEIVAKPPRRRRRGITAAQLANARRVNCKVASMARTLGVSTSRAPARRSTCRSKPSCR